MKMARIEAATRVALEFVAACNRRDAAEIGQLFAEEAVFEDGYPAPDGAVYRGKEAIAAFWQGFFATWPHAHVEVEEVIGWGLYGLVRWRRRLRDDADHEDHRRGVDLFRVQEGLIVEHRTYGKWQ